jgi:hypothetical protein
MITAELVARIAAATLERLQTLENEIAGIDATLARRPALADAPNRRAAIERACRRAGEADVLEAENARLRRQLATCQGAQPVHPPALPLEALGVWECPECQTVLSVRRQARPVNGWRWNGRQWEHLCSRFNAYVVTSKLSL